MFFVDNEGITDPRINFAIEEHLLRNHPTEEEIILFYINEPAVIIGRYQNALEEVNLEYVETNGIHVVRRLSGGGAVYHDLGNLNFSFITQNRRENFRNFQKFTAPVIQALGEMGVLASLSGRSDIAVEGRKVSGNAQYIAGRRMVSHGTLLFDSDLECVNEALRVKPNRISSKGIKSVRSQVANITEFLPGLMEIETFRARLLASIFAGETFIPQYHLDEEDWYSIRALAEERYLRWEWNYGRAPDYTIQKAGRFDSGEVEASIEVKQGLIQAIRFEGEIARRGDLADLETRLIGVRYQREHLAEALQGVDLSHYFGETTFEEFFSFLY